MQLTYDCFSVVRVESPHCDPYWVMKTRNPGFRTSKACHPIFLNRMMTSPRQSQIALTDIRKKRALGIILYINFHTLNYVNVIMSQEAKATYLLRRDQNSMIAALISSLQIPYAQGNRILCSNF